ncbi:MAG: GAF domain-containing sensor histidine kinase [Chloroflexi bacterium]|nr:GAF domain-containing sensor histidine kinase [Chloroflexota bacterium]
MAVSLLWFGVPESQALAAVEIWGRYLLATPGAVLAAVGLLGEARQQRLRKLPHIAAHLQVAAIFVLGYGIFGGLVPVPGPILLAPWLNSETLRATLGVPAPIFRSALGLGMAYTIIHAMDVFRIEMDRRLEAAERARFEVAERSRLALSSLAMTLSRPLDPQRLLMAALEEVLRVMGLARGWILVAAPDTGELRLAAAAGLSGLADCHPRGGSAVDACACWRAFREGKVAADEQIRQCGFVAGCDDPQLTWHISAPLKSRDRALGTISLAGEPQQRLVQEDRELLTAVGIQIGVAIENARLGDELRQKEAIRAHLLERLINAQEDERKRIARDLHDEAGQALSAVALSISAARNFLPPGAERSAQILDDTNGVIAATLQGVRRMILDLRPSALDDLGLASGLRRYAADLSARSGIAVRVHVDGLLLRANGRLPPQVETVLFRIVQEALTNVVKHSRARAASVAIQMEGSDVVAVVADDGQGFDLATVGSQPGAGLGLVGMQERAGLVGGTVRVESAPGQGTRVQVRLPAREVVT